MQRKTNDHPAGKNVLLNSEYTDTRTAISSLIINCISREMTQPA